MSSALEIKGIRCSLIVWLTAGHLFIFLFISSVLNRHTAARDICRLVSMGRDGWTCVDYDACFKLKICFSGVVGFDTSGLHALIRQAYIYSKDTHNDEYLRPCLHEETLQFLIQKCVYSDFYPCITRSELFHCLSAPQRGFCRSAVLRDKSSSHQTVLGASICHMSSALQVEISCKQVQCFLLLLPSEGSLEQCPEATKLNNVYKQIFLQLHSQ